MSKDINFGDYDRHQKGRNDFQPYDYEQENIFTDEKRGSKRITPKDDFSDWNDMPSRQHKNSGNLDYNDFMPNKNADYFDDLFDTVQFPTVNTQVREEAPSRSRQQAQARQAQAGQQARARQQAQARQQARARQQAQARQAQARQQAQAQARQQQAEARQQAQLRAERRAIAQREAQERINQRYQVDSYLDSYYDDGWGSEFGGWDEPQPKKRATYSVRGDVPINKQEAAAYYAALEAGKQRGRRNASGRGANGRNLPEPQSRRKATKKKSGCLKKIISMLLIVCLLYGGTSLFLFGKTDLDLKSNGINLSTNPLTTRHSLFVTNILLLGVDARPGETASRSDTMILVSIDRLHRKIKMTSFLRDSYVYIPGHGNNKLNAAQAKGGTNLLIKTLEYNYKVHINKYVMVNFDCFTSLIDALGGVDVKVTPKEANYLNTTWQKWTLTGNPLHYESGEHVHMNGEKALMFSRIRKLDSDVMRAERQRRVISALKEKAFNLNPSDIMSLMNTVMPYITTDMMEFQIMNKLIGFLLLYRTFDIEQASVPMYGTYKSENIKGVGSCLTFDVAYNRKLLKDFIYHDKLPD